MSISDAFDDFLIRKVNLTPTQLNTLNERVDAVTSYLREHPDLRDHIDDFVPQGSFAQKTIIKPINKPVFDADILMRIAQVPGWTAADYTAQLKRVLLQHHQYKTMVHKRTRCVYIDYADEFHIDVVPYVIPRTAITNNKDNSYELSRPEQFNTWLDEKNRTAAGNLPEVIRLLKWLRDKRSNATKSLFLTVLVGNVIDAFKTIVESNYYADVPTAFAHVVADLATYLEARPTLPYLLDPAGTGCDLADRWTPEGYTAFRNWITLTLAPKVAAAAAATDEGSAETLWQAVFGDDFKIPSAALVTKASAAPAPRTEMFLPRDFGIALPAVLPDKVSLVGRVRQHGVANKAYDLPSRGNRVGKGRTIDFEVRSCTVAAPYDVYFKVRNHGDEAAALSALRGEITQAPAGQSSRMETTSYRGTHYVEVYIVKSGVCVAKDHQEVVVTR